MSGITTSILYYLDLSLACLSSVSGLPHSKGPSEVETVKIRAALPENVLYDVLNVFHIVK